MLVPKGDAPSGRKILTLVGDSTGALSAAYVLGRTRNAKEMVVGRDSVAQMSKNERRTTGAYRAGPIKAAQRDWRVEGLYHSALMIACVL